MRAWFNSCPMIIAPSWSNPERHKGRYEVLRTYMSGNLLLPTSFPESPSQSVVSPVCYSTLVPTRSFVEFAPYASWTTQDPTLHCTWGRGVQKSTLRTGWGRAAVGVGPLICPLFIPQVPSQ